ncbi:hypothetical protein K2X92_05280 [Candidatus Gracilibacteria bacterium]|nr:hypothetical protein [Candidatus Gracilibacteria bacterium]
MSGHHEAPAASSHSGPSVMKSVCGLFTEGVRFTTIGICDGNDGGHDHGHH